MGTPKTAPAAPAAAAAVAAPAAAATPGRITIVYELAPEQQATLQSIAVALAKLVEIADRPYKAKGGT